MTIYVLVINAGRYESKWSRVVSAHMDREPAMDQGTGLLLRMHDCETAYRALDWSYELTLAELFPDVVDLCFARAGKDDNIPEHRDCVNARFEVVELRVEPQPVYDHRGVRVGSSGSGALDGA